MKEEDVDLVLRRVMAPTPDSASRVAGAALATASRRERMTSLLLPIGGPLTAIVVVILAVLLWPTPPPAAQAAAVYSVGELIVGVPPSGPRWIVGPTGGESYPAGPRIVVVKGEVR